MNQWILLFSLILGLGGTGCENREPGIITIMGEIKGLPEGWVRLYTCPPSNLLLDSCEIREGKYKLKGKLDDPQLGMLFLMLSRNISQILCLWSGYFCNRL